MIELSLCEEPISRFCVSGLSSSGSEAPVIAGAAESFVGNSNTSGMGVIVGVGADLVGDREGLVGTIAVLVVLWNGVCSVWYGGAVTGIY